VTTGIATKQRFSDQIVSDGRALKASYPCRMLPFEKVVRSWRWTGGGCSRRNLEGGQSGDDGRDVALRCPSKHSPTAPIRIAAKAKKKCAKMQKRRAKADAICTADNFCDERKKGVKTQPRTAS